MLGTFAKVAAKLFVAMILSIQLKTVMKRMFIGLNFLCLFGFLSVFCVSGVEEKARSVVFMVNTCN